MSGKLKKILNLSVLIIMIIIVIGLSIDVEAQNIKVYTSFYNLYEVTSFIGGDNVDVFQVVPDGSEIHSYEPSPRKMANMESADIFFYVGIDLEPWADSAVRNLNEAGVRTVKVSKNVNLIEYDEDHSHEHNDHNHSHNDYNHGNDHHHEHGDYDPHIWLDPLNMKSIAETIKNELITLDPDNKEYYDANYEEYALKIDQLDQKYKEELLNVDHKYIMVSHAAFGYLGHRYGFEQLSVTGITPHEEPSPGTLARLMNKAKELELEYIFLETLASPRTVNIIAEEAELEILVLNPLEGLTEEEIKNGENYFTIMEKNLENLKKALIK